MLSRGRLREPRISDSGVTNFEQVLRRERTGELVIGVDWVVARKFYTDVPVGVVMEHTGEVTYIEKGLVLAAWFGSPVALLVSAVLTPFVIGWWSASRHSRRRVGVDRILPILVIGRSST